jgi:hypothetical protein
VIQESKAGSKLEIDALNEEGAEWVGEETNTTMRYMDRILARNGPCERDPDNDELIIFKEVTYYFLSPEELLEVFPVEGQMNVNYARVAEIMATAALRMGQPITGKLPEEARA